MKTQSAPIDGNITFAFSGHLTLTKTAIQDIVRSLWVAENPSRWEMIEWR
ncbi:MAG TPA: hypothetical protein VEO53_03600 [Candidatus Binatia bacterium]|nr:hypothetical protein [Candidatus Binatia bacterium]